MSPATPVLRMKKEGYRIENLPESAKELEKMIQAQGAGLPAASGPPAPVRRILMNIETIQAPRGAIAVLSGGKVQITDAGAALDLAMSVRYETGASRLAIDKRLVCSDFFILSTGVAGDILQKLMNYRFKAAIYGDYSHYASKPLRDFIRESNHGKDFFFVSTMEEAVQRLTDAE